MIKGLRKTAVIFTAMTTMLASVGNYNAALSDYRVASVTYNDEYALMQDYLSGTKVSTVISEKHTAAKKVKVAIWDGNFELSHEDMQGVWVDDKELLDKLVGTDTEFGHGTACASVLSMAADNGIGGAGVCPNVELYPISLHTGGIKDYHINEKYPDNNELDDALEFCMRNDIKIITCSIGHAAVDPKQLKKFEEFGGVLVCSAGNTALDDDKNSHTPGTYSRQFHNIVQVTATLDGEYCDYANYGKETVSLGAPGDDIFAASANSKYSITGGTSMSAPYVAGVFALLSSYYPEATMAQIKDAIIEGVDKSADLQGRCVAGGCVNAKKAMEILQKEIGCEVSEGDYYIRNTQTGKYLTCYGNGTGSNVSTMDFFNYDGSEQKWRVEYTSDNRYVIFPSTSQAVCLEAYGNLCSQKGNNVWENTFKETAGQKWELESQNDGSFKILSAGDQAYGISSTQNATKGNEKVSQDTLALDQASDANTWVFEKIDKLHQDTYFLNLGEKYLRADNQQSVAGSEFYNAKNEKWRFKYRGAGFYTIHGTENDWSCLEASSTNVTDGTSVAMAGYQGNQPKQLWKVAEGEDGTVRIQSGLSSDFVLSLNASSGLVLKKESSTDDSQNITLEEEKSILDGTYFIRNSETDQYLSSDSSEAKAFCTYKKFTRTDKERFYVAYEGNGYYNISPEANRTLRLDAYNGTPKDNYAVWQYKNNDSAAQKWKITQNEDQTYEVASKISNRYVWSYNAEAGSSTTSNKFGVMTKDASSMAQKWYFESLADTYEGRVITTPSSQLSNGKFEYIGNGRYMIERDGKRLQLFEPYERDKYTEQGYPKTCMKIAKFSVPDETVPSAWFVVKEMNGHFYICPNSYRYTGFNHKGRNLYLSGNSEEQKWTVR